MPSTTTTTKPRASSKRKPPKTKTVSASETVESENKKRVRSEVAVTLGKSLKALRIARDLSQEQLAGEAELDRTYISTLERGLTNPTILTLSTICFCLKISLSELLAPVTENLKPSWADPDGYRRRTNQAMPDRIDKRIRLK